jgi:hypothetical protein
VPSAAVRSFAGWLSLNQSLTGGKLIGCTGSHPAQLPHAFRTSHPARSRPRSGHTTRCAAAQHSAARCGVADRRTTQAIPEVARGLGPLVRAVPGQHARTAAATPLITIDDARASDLTAYIGSSPAECRGRTSWASALGAQRAHRLSTQHRPAPVPRRRGGALRPGVPAYWSGLAQPGRPEGRSATHRYYGNPQLRGPSGYPPEWSRRLEAGRLRRHPAT